MKSPVRFILVLSVLAAIATWALAHERGNHRQLVRELQIAQRAATVVDELRGENGRLRVQQIPVIELDRLRADHAVLPGLRAELEDLRKRMNAALPVER